jgi:hypothetical protein
VNAQRPLSHLEVYSLLAPLEFVGTCRLRLLSHERLVHAVQAFYIVMLDAVYVDRHYGAHLEVHTLFCKGSAKSSSFVMLQTSSSDLHLSVIT